MPQLRTNVIFRSYPVTVYGVKSFNRKGGILDTFTIEAESSESAKLKAQGVAEYRIRTIYGEPFEFILEVGEPKPLR